MFAITGNLTIKPVAHVVHRWRVGILVCPFDARLVTCDGVDAIPGIFIHIAILIVLCVFLQFIIPGTDYQVIVTAHTLTHHAVPRFVFRPVAAVGGEDGGNTARNLVGNISVKRTAVHHQAELYRLATHALETNSEALAPILHGLVVSVLLGLPLTRISVAILQCVVVTTEITGGPPFHTDTVMSTVGSPPVGS